MGRGQQTSTAAAAVSVLARRRRTGGAPIVCEVGNHGLIPVRCAAARRPLERIAGATYRQDQLTYVHEYFERTGRTPVAELIAEPDNPHDPNAVAVYSLGRKIGHLPQRHAAQIQPLLLQLKDRGRSLMCSGVFDMVKQRTWITTFHMSLPAPRDVRALLRL